ncbi:MAG TPA: flagellar protein FlgN [Noviherbaspirillum sp.]
MQDIASNPAATLAEELAAGRSLLQLLKDEQELLIKADVDGLNKATEEKSRLVGTMGELALRRHRSLAAAGHPASESGMQDWLNSLKDPKAGQQIRQTWSTLIELGSLAKELNRTNGMLIGQHMARTQNALYVLQGGQQGEQLYGPNGQATGPGGGRTLVVG